MFFLRFTENFGEVGRKSYFCGTNPTIIYVYRRQIRGLNCTPARTRLYRMGIAKYLSNISEDFEVQGLQNSSWKKFVPNGNYTAFLIKKKYISMTISEIKDGKIPMFKVNPALNALLDVPMFEDKIAAANKILRTVGLPDPILHIKQRIKRTRKKKAQ